MSRALVLDVGNGALSVGIIHEDRLEDSMSFPLDRPWQASLLEVISRLAPIDHVLLASVKPEVNPLLLALLDDCELRTFELNAEELSIAIDGNKTEIGADLIANAYGAWRHHPGHNIVIDMGTAITFQAVHRDLRFLGGAICPGLEMSALALHHQTALLPLIQVNKPEQSCSLDTETAMRSGLYYGFIGTCERIVREWKFQLFGEEAVNVILTGGLTRSELRQSIAEDLKGLLTAIEPELTLLGLNEVRKEYLQKQHCLIGR